MRVLWHVGHQTQVPERKLLLVVGMAPQGQGFTTFLYTVLNSGEAASVLRVVSGVDPNVFRYRVQGSPNPSKDDRSFDTLSAAKGQITRAARLYQDPSLVLVDQVTGARYAYNRDTGKVVMTVSPMPKESHEALTRKPGQPVEEHTDSLVGKLLPLQSHIVQETERDLHENISPHQAHGRTILKVYDADSEYRAYPSNTQVPDDRYLLNFELTFDQRTLLVLDNYGAYDDGLPVRLAKRVFNGLTFGNSKTGATLAIDKKSGEIFCVAFGVEDRETIAIVWSFSPGGLQFKMPKRHLRDIDELKSCKRPFRLLLDADALYSFIDRETGYEALRQSVVIRFDSPRGLEVRQDSYRHVGSWSEF